MPLLRMQVWLDSLPQSDGKISVLVYAFFSLRRLVARLSNNPGIPIGIYPLVKTLGPSVTNDVHISFGFAYDLCSTSRKEVGEGTMLENVSNHLSRS